MAFQRQWTLFAWSRYTCIDQQGKSPTVQSLTSQRYMHLAVPSRTREKFIVTVLGIFYLLVYMTDIIVTFLSYLYIITRTTKKPKTVIRSFSRVREGTI
jgi:hypothetical protein